MNTKFVIFAPAAQNFFFQNFLRTTVEYVDKWFRIERFPNDLDWISLKTREISRDEILSLAEHIAEHIQNCFKKLCEVRNMMFECNFHQ